MYYKFIKSLLICCLLLGVLNIFADELDEIDKFLDKGEEEINFKRIDYLSKKHIKNNNYHRTLFKNNQREKVKLKPEVFYAILKQDSILIKLKDSEKVRAQKRIIVSAKEIYYGGKYSILFDKNRRKSYKTLTSNLISIDEDVKLYPKMNPQKTYTKNRHYLSMDKNMTLKNHINLSEENINITPLASYLNLDANSAKANSLEYALFYKTNFPIDFGISLSFQSGSFIDDNIETKWRAIYLGPHLSWNAFQKGELGINIGAAIKHSLDYNLVSNYNNYKFDSTLWQISTELDYKTTFGKVALGMAYLNGNYQMKKFSEVSTNLNGNQSANGSALSVFIGHRFEINI